MAEDKHKLFNEPIDPTKPLAIYTKKQERCQALAADSGNPITMADMVQTGVMHAVATGLIHNAYQEWKQIHNSNACETDEKTSSMMHSMKSES